MPVNGVSIQRLNVPDLVVIDQLNQPHLLHQQSRPSEQNKATQSINQNLNNQPEAASLINGQDLNHTNDSQQSQITFECLISFDRRKDKNLIVKWHHDDRIEPIYQWIPELNKRSIAPQYRAFIAPIVSGQQALLSDSPPANGSNGSGGPNQAIASLEAGFRLVRPSKELGGKFS